MQRDTLINAVNEAKRFIDKAEECLKYDSKEGIWAWGGRETAAVKRSSMDLTVSLADLRQGR